MTKTHHIHVLVSTSFSARRERERAVELAHYECSGSRRAIALSLTSHGGR